MYSFIFQLSQIKEKQHFFDKWDKKNVPFDEYSPYKDILNYLKDNNADLCKIAFSLMDIYQEAHLQQENIPNICELLNEWLSNKKKKNKYG